MPKKTDKKPEPVSAGDFLTMVQDTKGLYEYLTDYHIPGSLTFNKLLDKKCTQAQDLLLEIEDMVDEQDERMEESAG